MRFTKFPVVGVLFGLSLIAACRGDSKVTPDAGGGPGIDASDGKLHHIQEVQSDTTTVNTPVELHGVIVTAVDKFGTRNGQIWVEEPGGGERSGVTVFGAPLAQVTNLTVGDVVDITGAVKSEFVINGDTSGRSLTELVAPTGGMMMITKTGTATPPAPALVDALMIGIKPGQTDRDVEWEKWEGVLITVVNVAASNAPACIKSKGVCTDVDSFSITGVVNVESGLAGFPASGVQGGDCFESITGVVDYAFGYVLYPRTTDEVVAGGTGCIRETSLGSTNLCTDGLDNDGDSFKDCSDFDCEVGPNAWLGLTCADTDAMCGCSTNLVATGVNKVNTGTTGAVLLHNVIVTAVGPTGYWIADAAQAAQRGGVFVFTKTPPDASIAIGSKLPTVQGVVSVFNGSKTAGSRSVISISRPTAGAATPSGVPLVPIPNPAIADLSDVTKGEPFMGSLVQLTTVKVKAVDTTTNIVTLVDNANATIKMSNHVLADFGGTVPNVGDCYPTLIGIMDFNTSDPQTRTINPRTTDDMVTGSGCTGN